MRTIRKITIPLAVIASVLCFSAAKEKYGNMEVWMTRK